MNVNQLKALDGVINVVLQQTKIQIVIGPKVQQVYDQLELLREQSAPSMVINQLKALDGVINVVLQQTKIQIVIGPKVQQVYDQLELLREQSAPSMVIPSHQRKTSLISRILDTISRIFTPVIGAIAGAGMIKALLALLVAANLIDKTGQNYYVLNFIGDAAFYFMPILLAMSAAKQFKCNAYLAVVLAGILLHPHLIELKSAG